MVVKVRAVMIVADGSGGDCKGGCVRLLEVDGLVKGVIYFAKFVARKRDTELFSPVQVQCAK